MNYDFALVNVTHEDDMDGIETWLIVREGLEGNEFRAVLDYAVSMGSEVTHQVSEEQMARIQQASADGRDYYALDHGAMIDFGWDCDFGTAHTVTPL